MSGSIYVEGKKYISIPVPQVAPLGWEVEDPEMIKGIWDTFVQPDIDAQVPQSVEMRVLMAVLRAVYEGLSER